MHKLFIRCVSVAAALSLVGLLAADTAAAEAVQKGKTLKITYDGKGPESVSLSGNGLGNVDVTINAASEMFVGVVNILIQGSDAADTICINPTVEIEGNLGIKSGDGDDTMYVSGTYGKNVKVDLGDGDDTHYECSDFMTVAGNYLVKAGNGDDNLHWDQDITVGKNMKLLLGNGNDAGNQDTILHGCIYMIEKNLIVKLSKEGGQILELENVSAAKLIVAGGKGEDELDLVGGNNFGQIKTKNVEIGVPAP